MQHVVKIGRQASAALGLASKAKPKEGAKTPPPPSANIVYKPPSGADRFAIIELARPKKRNAINVKMYKELIAAFRRASADPMTGAIVLTGQGDFYSAGNDLSNFFYKVGHPRMVARETRDMCIEFVNAFVECEKPIIAAVNGDAIGIPVTTLGLCDYRISVEGATFHTPFKQLAQAPEGCSSFMFPKLMGPVMADRMLAHGDKVTAAELHKVGFIHATYDYARLHHKAFERARQLAAETIDEKQKRPLYRGEADDHKFLLKSVNRRECHVLEKAWVSEECLDALEKFLSSRKYMAAATAIRVANKTRYIWDKEV